MKRLSVVVLSLLLFGAVSVQAADTKIGYVDLQKALNVSIEGKAAKEKITVKVKEYETVIDKRQQELKKLKDELEKRLKKVLLPVTKTRDLQSAS